MIINRDGAGAELNEGGIKATGGCLCGAVRYHIRGALQGIVNCHCSKCHPFHGNVGTYTRVALGEIEIVENRCLKWFRSAIAGTPTIQRGFCVECGSSLFWHPGDQQTISVAAGSFGQTTGLETIGHVWIGQIGDLYEIRDDLPGFERGWNK